jgi:2-C-methyl-D-erythritol 4-phosphate cytidylyltransferase
MLDWSLAAFEAAETIRSIVVVVPPGSEADVAREAVVVVPGGTSRSESVAAGMGQVETELVAVHDAARPLVTPALIDELVNLLVGRPDAAAVIAAAPLTDTVKRAHDPRDARGEAPHGALTVAGTESRDHLWAAQTPQVFRSAVLRKALSGDAQSLREATDDAMLVEQAGGNVLMHPAPVENLKVTTPADLRLAELLLAERDR